MMIRNLEDLFTIIEGWLVSYTKYFEPSADDIVADIGAHIGTFTTAWAPRVQTVYSFEPQPETFATLKENIKPFDNVVAYNTAISDYIGEARMSLNASTINDIHCTDESYAIVPVTTLDSILPRADFLKIDVEGEEIKVLRGAKDLLSKYKPKIAMEVHSEDNLTSAKEILVGYGYDFRVEPYWQPLRSDLYFLYAW